jgi:hypothetical protein
METHRHAPTSVSHINPSNGGSLSDIGCLLSFAFAFVCDRTGRR